MPYFLTDDAVKLSYEIAGEGDKTLVLIHGGSANSKYFKKNVPVLSKQYKVVTYDLRGHGESEIPDRGYTTKRLAKDLKNLIDFLGLKNVYLAGWSLGTSIMLSYAEEFGQDNIAGFIIIDMTAKPVSEGDSAMGAYGGFTLIDSYQAVMAINESWVATLDGLASSFFSDPKNNEDEVSWVVNEEMKNSESVMTRIWVNFATIDQRHILPQITVPTLIVYGGAEKVYKREESEYLHQNIKGSRLVRIENASHGLFLEQADEFNKAVIDFIG